MASALARTHLDDKAGTTSGAKPSRKPEKTSGTRRSSGRSPLARRKLAPAVKNRRGSDGEKNDNNRERPHPFSILPRAAR